ncbi:MAG: baseplate protein [Hellea sp.]|nr:baseplate protein [Hellea sp.]
MTLPKIDLPIYEMELPSTGETVKYRPFTVKEEKILLVAQASKDSTQEMVASKQIVNNCLIDYDVMKLAMFDLELILLTLRSKSVDNLIEMQITDPDTDETVDISIDLMDTEVIKNDKHSNQVKINDDYTLILKYPSIDEYIRITEMDEDDPLVSYQIMVSCLDKVASEDEVYEFKKYSQKEIDQFMEDVTTPVVDGIRLFFETMPKIRHTKTYKNKNGDTKNFVIEGMRSFFT